MDLIVDEKPLAPAEQNRLGELEAIIRDNFLAYIAVGNALLEIRESRLYRTETGRTWEGYCRELWDMSHQRADQLIAAKTVVENLTTIVVKEDGSPDWELLPANESQARELARLEPKEQVQVWQHLLSYQQATSEDDKPFRLTAKTVKAAVKELKGSKITDLAGQIKNGIQPRKTVDPNRESEAFRQAWVGLVEQIEDERNRNWKNTDRQVVFKSILRLADMVGECGAIPIRAQKITFKRHNLEKLAAAGWSVLRQAGESAIEQLSDDGSWLLYGEYETKQQRDEAFEDALLEPTSIEA